MYEMIMQKERWKKIPKSSSHQVNISFNKKIQYIVVKVLITYGVQIEETKNQR